MPGYGILDAKKGRGLLPWSWAQTHLSMARNYTISTVRPSGRPHLVAVWGVWLDDKFYFSTGRRSVKARNLAANPKCVIGFVHVDDDESIVVEGTAKAKRGRRLWQRFASAYEMKYNWDMSGFDRDPLFEVRPTKAFAFSAHGDFEGTATRWRFPQTRTKDRSIDRS